MAVLTAALLVSLLAVSGFAQFQSGNIYGKVQAKDGSVLPGVTVTLTGMGAPQTAVTDAQGNFRFLNLSPGAGYALKAELAGYGTAARTGITVRVGSNADVTLTLNPSVSESIVVTAEAPLLDVRKAGTAINVTKVELEKIPTSRDPWTVLQQAPAVQVDRINVGGSQSGQQSVYDAKGADSSQNTWNMDGVNITDMGATGSSPLYFDFDSFEEMQITTGGSDPRIQTPGVQLNMVTKRGTNDFRGSGRYFYTPGSYQADATVPGEATSYLVTTNKINYVRDYGAEVGGPVWKDHLWFWVASAENKISNQASTTPASTGAFDNIILRDKNAKLNLQVTPSNSAVGFYTFGDKVRNARNLSSTRPFEAAWRQTGPTKVYKLEDTQIIGSSLYLTGMWSKVSGGFSLIPNGGISDTIAPIFLDSDFVWHSSFLYYITQRPQKQYRLDGSKFFDIGTMNHELKFGFGYRKTPVASISGWGGPQNGYTRYVGQNSCKSRNVPINAGEQCMFAALYRTRNAAIDDQYRDFYAGDTILLGNLTLQAGLRWDRQKSINLPTSTPANPIIGSVFTLPVNSGAFGNQAGLPAISYPGDAQALKWNSVAPRLGLTYSLGADKKTLLRAGYNRYINQLGAQAFSASPLGAYSYFYFVGVDRNLDKIAQKDELARIIGIYNVDPSNPAALTSTTRLDYGMKPPHSDEFLLGFERELLTDFSVGVTGTYRKYHDLLETRAEHHQGAGDFFTSADYTAAGTVGGTYTQCPAGYGFPSGQDPVHGTTCVNSAGATTPALATITTPVVTFYDLKNPNDPPVFGVVRNRPGYTQEFKGLEFTATKRLSHRWMMRGNLSWNDWTEQCSAESIVNPTPALGNCPGGQVVERSAGSDAFQNVFINSRWSFNLTGLYQLPWDFNLGASVTGRQGYPQPYRANAVVSTGNVNVILNPVGDTRFPNVYEVDLRAAKDFRFFNRVGLTLSADLFNVPNQRTILQRQTQLENNDAIQSNANRITEMQSPRVWRFGARFNF
jgi:hypothetical protein